MSHVKINLILSQIISMAINITNAAKESGDVDFSDTESMFQLMKEVATLPNPGKDAHETWLAIEPDLARIYDACLCTSEVDSADCLGGHEGLPGDWKDLPEFILNLAPEHKAIDQTERAIALLRDASIGMSKRDRIAFQVQLADLLSDYDLMGEEGVEIIFNAK